MADEQLVKGARAEEALLRHFISSGAFAVRGVKVLEADEEITDIDVWGYFRSGDFARSITIADVKNKKSARSFERITWIRGVQAVTGADVAMVATSENRQEAAAFAERLSVRLIPGATLKRLMSEDAAITGRLTQEQFFARIDAGRGSGKRPSDRIERATALLASGIEFSSLNHWIDDAFAALSWCVELQSQAEPGLRCAYYLTALIALGCDHLSNLAPFESLDNRRERLLDGFVFGDRGRQGTDTLIKFAEAAARQIDQTGATSAAIRKGIEKDIASAPFAAMAEFGAKASMSSDLFEVARSFESLALAESVIAPVDLSPDHKALLGVLCDVGGIARPKLFSAKAGDSKSQPSAKPLPSAKASTGELFDKK